MYYSCFTMSKQRHSRISTLEMAQIPTYQHYLPTSLVDPNHINLRHPWYLGTGQAPWTPSISSSGHAGIPSCVTTFSFHSP